MKTKLFTILILVVMGSLAIGDNGEFDYSELHPYLYDITLLDSDDSYFIVGDGTDWIRETGNTARTSLGLGTGDSPAFTAVNVTGGLIAMSTYPTTTDCIFIGTEPPYIDSTAEKCVAVGIGALLTIDTAHYNTAIGHEALNAHRIGGTNTALGCQALYSDDDGVGNTAIGARSSYWSDGGQDNTMVGGYAGFYQLDGDKNTAVGVGAGYGAENQSHSNNSMFGYYAGYALTTGGNNILLGHYAGSRQTSNSNLLIIDNQQRANVATELTNAILYGVMASAPASQTLRINAALTVNGDIDLPDNSEAQFGTGGLTGALGMDGKVYSDGTNLILQVESPTGGSADYTNPSLTIKYWNFLGGGLYIPVISSPRSGGYFALDKILYVRDTSGTTDASIFVVDGASDGSGLALTYNSASDYGQINTFGGTSPLRITPIGDLLLNPGGTGVRIGSLVAPSQLLDVAGAIGMLERSSDPPEPAEGNCVIWMSDGTGKGDDGDVLIASNPDGTTRWGTLFDYSGGGAW